MIATLYAGVTALAPLLLVPPFLLSSRGRERLTDRLGLWHLDLPSSIWIHGASLGEMQGIVPVVNQVKLLLTPEASVLSCTSPTALPRAREVNEHARLLPFDHPLYFRKVIESIRPRLFIISETEIWPNLLSEMYERRVPTILINARISDKSFKRYLSVKRWIGPCIRKMTHIFAASSIAKERFLALGAEEEKVSIHPNTKFDQGSRTLLSAAEIDTLREGLFASNDPIVCLNSIRPGEEKFWFPAIKRALDAGKKLQFLIAPRHKEKFSEFESSLQAHGLEFSRRSAGNPSRHPICLLDTHGELTKLTAVASLAFVGGTLAPFGGHNPLESAPYSIPPLAGPFTANIAEEISALEKEGGICRIGTVDDINGLLERLGKEPAFFAGVGMAAHAVYATYQGSARDLVLRIKSLVPGL